MLTPMLGSLSGDIVGESWHSGRLKKYGRVTDTRAARAEFARIFFLFALSYSRRFYFMVRPNEELEAN
jgi:hypothetical protein